MTSFVTTHIASGGLALVFILMAAESCGIPFPSELIMPFAGFLASQGHLSLAGAIVAGTLGNLLGSLVAYVLAASFGKPLMLGPGRYIGLSQDHLELAERWFAKYGSGAVLIGRVLPVVRTYISFPAGLARVPLPAFAILTTVGALPWCAALAAGGYAIGRNYDRISGPIQTIALVFAGVVVLVLVGWFLRGRSRKRGGPAA
ncbi:MAG: DedA family protein [Candidatus Dormibacteria bacterium]